MSLKNFIHDPIHGTIEVPDVLIPLLKEKSVRRMQFIRQLGLKAFIDFPNAIHTRYSHVIGVMHLTGRVVDRLTYLETTKGKKETAQTLSDNKNNLMAAGLLHDIGHGPFSHVLDYFLEKYCKVDHEKKAMECIEKFSWLEDRGLNIKKIQNIIEGKHPYPFINGIINGPLDCDKLDYLLRDSYHVGLKYSFDLNHFINYYGILGEDISKLENCDLGLVNDPNSIKTAEIFIVIWKNMYDLVYHVKHSRIAEKMLEKAIMLKYESNNDFINCFLDYERYIELEDENLLSILEKDNSINSLTSRLVKCIRSNNLYSEVYNKNINSIESVYSEKNSTNFLNKLDENSNDFADTLSKKLCSKYNYDKYEIICDFIKSRKPKRIHLDAYDEDGEPIELDAQSRIIPAINEETILKIYVDSKKYKSIREEDLEKFIKEAINELSGE